MGSRRLVSALLTTAGGCATGFYLGEVPIEGGTAEQRDAVAQELAAFETWIGSGRIRVARIKLTSTSDELGGATGSYRVWPNAVVQLAAELDPSELREALRHELCHGVDVQEDLLSRPEPIFDAAVARARSDPAHPIHEEMEGSKREMRSEVLAFVCQRGPLGTALLARPCPTDSSEYAEVARWVGDQVWTGEPDVRTEDPIVRVGSPIEWEAPSRVNLLEAIGSEAAEEALIVPQMDDVPQFGGAFVSTILGSEVPRFADFTYDAIEAGLATEPPYGAPGIPMFDPTVVDSVEAVSDGITTIRIVKGFAHRDLDRMSSAHLITHDDGGWSVVNGACPTDTSSVFLANDRLHLAWADGAWVSWVPLE